MTAIFVNGYTSVSQYLHFCVKLPALKYLDFGVQITAFLVLKRFGILKGSYFMLKYLQFGIKEPTF
jgi:hypothetical protein